MHDLPPEIEALLVCARSEQIEPDALVRERVKRGVLVAIASGAVVSSAAHASAHAAAKGWFAGSLATKFIGVAVVGAVAVGTAITPSLLAPPAAPSSAQRTREARGAGSHERVPRETSPEELAAPASAPESSSAVIGKPLEGARSAPSHASLAAELRLLDHADRALSRGDPATARALLARHRAEFTDPALVEEREGLDLIARCQRDRALARADARAFLARAAHSVLSVRVARACEGTP